MIMILIYLIGYICSYILLKRLITSDTTMWANGDRLFSLMFSILSWLLVIALLIIKITKYINDSNYLNKESKW